MQLLPVTQPSLVDEVAIRLRGLVESGRLTTGDRLPSEPELVKRLKVSRTVLREAIGRLEAIGLLTVRRGSGTFVANGESLTTATQLIRSALAISTHDLLKVAELRRCIETHCSRRAAIMATDAEIADLDAHYRRIIVPGATIAETMKADFEFHKKIAQLSRNDVLSGVLQVIQDFVYASIAQTMEQPGLPQPPHNLHLEMLEAIRARDPERAERATSAHMDVVDARLNFVAKKAAAEAAPTDS